MSTAERFWAKVSKSDDCWEWTAYRTSGGYGMFRVSSERRTTAHRVAWELTFGSTVPPGMCVCHRCDNPPCVNPEHLFLGTYQANSDDMVRKGRQRSPSGERAATKLSAEAVTDIRNRFVARARGLRGNAKALAAEYGIGACYLREIIRGEKWAL